jgi:hypothetical protein
MAEYVYDEYRKAWKLTAAEYSLNCNFNYTHVGFLTSVGARDTFDSLGEN